MADLMRDNADKVDCSGSDTVASIEIPGGSNPIWVKNDDGIARYVTAQKRTYANGVRSIQAKALCIARRHSDDVVVRACVIVEVGKHASNAMGTIARKV
jgi:hypothetical protein